MSEFHKNLRCSSSGAFETQIQLLTDAYEQQLGRLPVWLYELNAERIVSLLACCIRIGMPLSVEDALEADEAERKAQALKDLRRPRGKA